MIPVIDLDNSMYLSFSPNIDNYVPVNCRYFDCDQLPDSTVESCFNLIMFNVRSIRRNF